MNASGWVMMILCVGGATTFFAWTVRLVLSGGKKVEKLHSEADRPPDLEPRA